MFEIRDPVMFGVRDRRDQVTFGIRDRENRRDQVAFGIRDRRNRESKSRELLGKLCRSIKSMSFQDCQMD